MEQRRDHRMHSGNRFKLGMFGLNCSSGLTMTKAPECWENIDRRPITQYFSAWLSTRAGLIASQFKKNVGVHAKSRRNVRRCRMIEPFKARTLCGTSLTPPKGGRVSQFQPRQVVGT
jgi:hypothetical protein